MTNKKLLTYFASSFLIIFISASLFNFNKTLKASTELPIKISESMERFEPKDHCFDIDFAHLIDSKKWYEIQMVGKIAFVFGSEGEGLRQITKKYCDYLATIPMVGDINSLNISATVSAILFERNRQLLK